MSIEKNIIHVPYYAKFIIGGLSGVTATLFVQPLDLIKIRMQLSGEGGTVRDYATSVGALRAIVIKEGVRGLYSGLSANIFRQATYTTFRLGIYQMTLEDLNSKGYSGIVPQVSSGLLAGFFAAIIATPSDVRRYNNKVVFVRMTANGKLPISERRNYKNVFDALNRLSIEEGRTGMFAGLKPTVLRALVANVTQLVSYSQAKDFLTSNGYMDDDFKCHFASSLIAGFVYAFTTIPLDVVKTRIQNMKSEAGVRLYSGFCDCLVKTAQNEGLAALWKGFGPFYIRTAPHTMVLFVVNEKLNSLYKEKILFGQ